jgi:hypothetical protein
VSLSATWQELPPNLLQAVLDGHLLIWEAAWLWEEWLLTPEGEMRTLPEPLWPVAQRLHLMEMEVEPTRH